ncbi:MAG: hypothetical protein A3J27_01320 [Candidatus Tectomicrobia bacterium RIFCSPLOWO2_12_FULL_69_37]|nr:MAG: hypothetical protein A3J27_01320 [Candidatus Tectomicrobia bacterium RIFCSPLOWO2_12_FULL_69_37]
MATSSPLPPVSSRSASATLPWEASTTSWAPMSRHLPSFWAETSTAITRALAQRASATMWMPTPPPAPMTATFSRGAMRARLVTL